MFLRGWRGSDSFAVCLRIRNPDKLSVNLRSAVSCRYLIGWNCALKTVTIFFFFFLIVRIWNETELFRSCKPHIYHLEQLQRVCSAVIIPSCWALCCPQRLISELLKLNAFRDEMQLSAFSLPFQTHGVRGCKHFFAVYISSCLRNTNIYKLFYAPKSQRKTTHRDALLRNGGIDTIYYTIFCPVGSDCSFPILNLNKGRLKF